VIELSGVSKSFGSVHAVRDLSFTVPAGCFAGLIGHNGAGKSTTLRMLTGGLTPDSGVIKVAGVDVHADPQEAMRRMGIVPEQPAVFEYLTGREHLEFVAEVRGASDLAEMFELTALGTDLDRPISEYSQGMRRKIALTAAMLGGPQVIVLDEALNGLDPPTTVRFRQALRHLVDQGSTVLLSTHVVEAVESVADRAILLTDGALLAEADVRGMAHGELAKLLIRASGRSAD